MKIWLDDERPMPIGYDIHVRNSSYMLALIDTGLITAIAFDHDLGDGKPSGYDIAKYLEEKYANNQMNTLIKFSVHTANPVGRKNMCAALQSCEKWWRHYHESQENP